MGLSIKPFLGIQPGEPKIGLSYPAWVRLADGTSIRLSNNPIIEPCPGSHGSELSVLVCSLTDDFPAMPTCRLVLLEDKAYTHWQSTAATVSRGLLCLCRRSNRHLLCHTELLWVQTSIQAVVRSSPRFVGAKYRPCFLEEYLRFLFVKLPPPWDWLCWRYEPGPFEIHLTFNKAPIAQEPAINSVSFTQLTT